MQDLMGCGVDLGFYPEGDGSPGGLWAEEGTEPDSGAHSHPLVAAVGCREDRPGPGRESRSRGIGVQVIVQIQVADDGVDQASH